jgi:ribosomal protein S4
MFKKHIMRLASQSDSFFVTLESRLDRVFFRMRLLPTVFSCHQYIHYNGLEVNSKLEKSPSSLINVGDMISVPAAG